MPKGQNILWKNFLNRNSNLDQSDISIDIENGIQTTLLIFLKGIKGLVFLRKTNIQIMH